MSPAIISTRTCVMHFKTILTLFAVLILGSNEIRGQWTERGGPNGNYRVDSSQLAGEGPAWTKRLGVSESESVIDGDRILLTAADFTDSGTDATRILCLNRRTGSTDWSVLFPENSYVTQDISDRYPVRPLATPCIFGNSMVCVGYGGSVRCIDKRNGDCRWEFDLVKDFGAEPVQYGFATSPWSDGNQVLIACGGPAGTVLSVDLNTGKEKWRCGTGAASYCSFVEFQPGDGSEQIVYAAKDELLSIDPIDGSIAWQYPYPKKGLTNAVTPIAVDKGKLLVAGQGFAGTRLLEIERASNNTYQVKEVWENSKIQPFYCNWVQTQSDPNLVVGFAGKTIFVLDYRSGTIQSQSREWTDCNLIATPEGAIAIRGDGYIGKLVFRDGKATQFAGYGKIRDRVWSAATVADGSLIVRGKTALTSVPLNRLRVDEPIRSGTSITSMDAMYGSKTEAVDELIVKIKDTAKLFSWEDYLEKISDDSMRLEEEDMSQILKLLASNEKFELGLQIATDWVSRQPLSIPAFNAKIEFLRKLGRVNEAIMEEEARWVEVEFQVNAPNTLAPDTKLFIIGNAIQMGNWGSDGLQLEQDSSTIWRAKAKVPRGDLQFKVTGGSFDRVETREDGRNISNRRFRVNAPCEIRVDVAALKEVNNKPQ